MSLLVTEMPGNINQVERLITMVLNCLHLSQRIRKPIICICENKDADQLCSHCTADLRLCFPCTAGCLCFPSQMVQSFFAYNQNFKLLACFCDCTGQFVSDLVGNPNCWFSCVKAHLSYYAYL